MYCEICRIDTGNVCHQCGLTLSASAAIKRPADAENLISLWGPDTAALLSWLLLGISFGASVHAANWRRLGQQRRMWESIAWAMIPLACLAMLPILGLVFKVHLPPKFLLFSLMGMNGLLVAIWYFASGRQQSKYVTEHHKNAYVRESWFGPLALVAATIIVLAAVLA